MAYIQGRLADLPQLASWYEKLFLNPPDITQVAERFSWNICHALAAEESAAVSLFVSSMRSFLNTSTAPLPDFLATVSRFADYNVDLLAEFTLLAEEAVQSEHARSFGASIGEAAEATGLVALRFMSAWIALNKKDLERCLEECEKVDQPYAHIYALQGQALLELGRAEEAVLMLQGAVELSPSEIMAWFQLAKANHVLGKTSEAWSALQVCAKLVPNNAEIALMMGLVALSHDAQESMQVAASDALARTATRPTESFDLIYCRLRLATRLDRREETMNILKAPYTSACMRDRKFLGKLASLLREWHVKGWHESSEKLLATTLKAEGLSA